MVMTPLTGEVPILGAERGESDLEGSRFQDPQSMFKTSVGLFRTTLAQSPTTFPIFKDAKVRRLSCIEMSQGRHARLEIPASDDHSKRKRMLAVLARRQKINWHYCGMDPIPPPPSPSSLNFRIRRHSSLGDLQFLPLELLDIIFQFCHLQSLCHLLRLNSLFYNVVKKSLVYSTLRKHALDTLLVLSRTGAASYFTACQILDALSSSDCTLCRRPGFFLYLPECVRCCFVCIWKPEFDTMSIADAVAAFGLTKRSISTVPVVTTITSRPSKLVATRLAREAALVQYGGEDSLAAYMASPGPKRKQAYESKISRWTANCELNDRRKAFLAPVVMPFPYLERNTGVAHAGVWCQACIKASRRLGASGSRAWKEGYTEENFFRHIAYECLDAQILWKAFKEKEVQTATRVS